MVKYVNFFSIKKAFEYGTLFVKYFPLWNNLTDLSNLYKIHNHFISPDYLLGNQITSDSPKVNLMIKWSSFYHILFENLPLITKRGYHNHECNGGWIYIYLMWNQVNLDDMLLLQINLDEMLLPQVNLDDKLLLQINFDNMLLLQINFDDSLFCWIINT